MSIDALDVLSPHRPFAFPRHYLIRTRRQIPMPDQISGVVLTPHGTTFDLLMGPNGEQGLQTASLFDRTTFDAGHLVGNIRLKKVIGRYGTLWSREFVDAVNAGGVQTTAGTFYNLGFTNNPDGSVTLSFGTVIGGSANQTITVNPADLDDDTHDLDMVVKNIGAFLRLAGYTDLTTPAPNGIYAGKTAVQAVALQTFVF